MAELRQAPLGHRRGSLFFELIVGLLGLLWGSHGLGLDYVPGEVLVRYKDHSMSHPSKVVAKAQQKGLILKHSWPGLNMHQFQMKPGGNQGVGAKIEELLQDPDVLYAEPNYILRKASIAEADLHRYSFSEVDALRRAQSTEYAMTGANIQAPEAWSLITAGSSKSVVAIIDTGVDYHHSVFQLSDAIWVNPGEVPGNKIDDDGNGYIDDVHGWNFVFNNGEPLDDDGHGTHVAGTVLGVGQDIFTDPISESKIEIMVLKFLDANGSGTTAAAIQAIYYAVNHGAKVINNSWGGGSYSASLHEAIVYSYNQGVLFVAAAGNEGSDNDRYPLYPASYDVPNVLSIAASTDSDILASFSNFGKVSVDVGSPGVSIFSTFPNDTFGYSSGTSMATPFVSGLAALIVRESPEMTPYQVKNIIMNNGTSVTKLNGKLVSSSRIDVLKAIQVAQGAEIWDSMPSYDFSLSTQDRDLASTFSSSGGGGCGLVQKIDSRGDGDLWWVTPLLFLVFFCLPLIVALRLRHQTSSMNHLSNRRYQRYLIDSKIAIQVDGREIVGSVNSISLGGLGFNADALIRSGGTVAMTIFSPDGKEKVEVEGRVVWSENQKSYGVQFSGDGKASVIQTIGQWTSQLLKI